jgi:apolipoprotein N-acyltransferase
VRLVLVPGWDSGRDAWEHSRVAVLRGVEGGYSIVRAARDGFLTISDSYGRVLEQQRSSERPYAEESEGPDRIRNYCVRPDW